MTRTPTSSVTAINAAARAFAWDVPGGALYSGLRHGRGAKMPPLRSPLI